MGHQYHHLGPPPTHWQSTIGFLLEAFYDFVRTLLLLFLSGDDIQIILNPKLNIYSRRPTTP